MQDPSGRRTPSVADVLLYLVGIAGVAAGITITFLSMRAVMEIGGACADGGPYVSARPCPEGVPLATLIGILGGIASAFLAAWKGSVIGDGAGSVVLLAWPTLFGALGLNFLLYGFDPPGDDPGWAWGWLVCGVLFWAMAFGPLLVGRTAGWLLSPPSGSALARPAPVPPTADAPHPPEGDGRVAPPADALVDGLERLAALHATGALTDEEYARAKVELLERPWS